MNRAFLLVSFSLLGLMQVRCTDREWMTTPAGDESAGEDGPAAVGEPVGEGHSALIGTEDYWDTSYAPVSCDNGTVVDRLLCRDSYCRYFKPSCGIFGGVMQDISWTNYFSEEFAPTNEQTCPPNQLVVGLVCRGTNCDDIALECASFRNVTTFDCHWKSGTFSEEEGVGEVTSIDQEENSYEYAIAGIRCFNRYCDNKQIYECVPEFSGE